MEVFELEGKDFVELNKLLKIMGWVGTGGEAKLAIENEEAIVNGQVETQRRKKLRKGDLVHFRNMEVNLN